MKDEAGIALGNSRGLKQSLDLGRGERGLATQEGACLEVLLQDNRKKGVE